MELTTFSALFSALMNGYRVCINLVTEHGVWTQNVYLDYIPETREHRVCYGHPNNLTYVDAHNFRKSNRYGCKEEFCAFDY